MLFGKLFQIVKVTAKEIENQYDLGEKVEDVKEFAEKTANSARTTVASGLIKLAEIIKIKHKKQIKEIAPTKVEHIN